MVSVSCVSLCSLMPSAETSLVASVNSVLLSVYQIYSIYITYEVSYNGRTPYVSNYFCCRIQSNWKNLCDAERDLTAIVAFLVCFWPDILYRQLENLFWTITFLLDKEYRILSPRACHQVVALPCRGNNGGSVVRCLSSAERTPPYINTNCSLQTLKQYTEYC